MLNFEHKDSENIYVEVANNGLVHLSCILCCPQKYINTIHQENMSVKCIPPQTPLLLEKLRFAGEYLIVLFLFQHIHERYSLELPRRGSSSVYPQCMF